MINFHEVWETLLYKMKEKWLLHCQTDFQGSLIYWSLIFCIIFWLNWQIWDGLLMVCVRCSHFKMNKRGPSNSFICPVFSEVKSFSSVYVRDYLRRSEENLSLSLVFPLLFHPFQLLEKLELRARVRRLLVPLVFLRRHRQKELNQNFWHTF